LRGAHNAAFITAVMSYLQDAPLDAAMFYRGDAAWMGLFGLDGQYFKSAYAFKAMGMMLDTPQRLSVAGDDSFGLAAIAGRSADGNTVQVLITNYAIPAGFRPHTMRMPPELLKDLPSLPDSSKFKVLPRRTDIVYRDNAGYNLTINNLPWGKRAFSVKRYRISETKNLDLLEEKSGEGGHFGLSEALAPNAVELVILQRR